MEGPLDGSVTPVATGTPGDMAQPAPAQGEIVQPAPGQGDSAQPAPVNPAPEKGPVPWDRFDEVNRQKNDFQTRSAELERQLLQTQSLLAQIAQANQRPQGQPQAPADPFDAIPDQDLLDPAKVRQALKQARQDAISVAGQLVNQVQFQVQYGDFDKIVGAYNPITGQFIPSEVMAEAVKEDPQLPMKIQQSGNPRVFAYEIARRQQQLRELRNKLPQNQTPNPAPAPQPSMVHQIRAAQQAPQSISAANGAGAVDKISRIQNMTDTEFAQYWAGVKAGRVT